MLKPSVTRRTFVALPLAAALALCGCTASPAASEDGSGAAAGSSPEGSAERADDRDFRNLDIGVGIEHVSSFGLEYAENFTIDEFEGGYLLICVSNGERFLVVPEGSDAPQGLTEDIALIRQPIMSTYLVSTGMICLLDEIGALISVTVSSVTAENSPNEHLAAAIEGGQVAYGGKYSEPDFELIAERGCTLAIENTKINHAPEAKQKLQDLGVTVLTEQSSSEPEVLGRLEWIKLMGRIFDKADEAEAAFDRIASNVEDVAAQGPTGKTVAFFYINEDGAAVTRRSTDYFSQMIEMAGGDFISFDPADETEGSSSVQAVIDLETFYARAKDADVIIYNTTVDGSVSSIEDLVAKNALLEDFAAVRAGEVYACDENMYQAMTDMDAILADVRAALTDTDGTAGYIWKLS